jgi:hypothetical protein
MLQTRLFELHTNINLSIIRIKLLWMKWDYGSTKLVQTVVRFRLSCLRTMFQIASLYLTERSPQSDLSSLTLMLCLDYIRCSNNYKENYEQYFKFVIPTVMSTEYFLYIWDYKTFKNSKHISTREKVTTTKIRTSKTKKNIKKFGNHHYIESGFLVDHYYNITMASLHQKWLF